MRQKLVDHIKLRFRKEISTHNPLKYLSRYLVDDYMDFVIATVYLYTRPKRGAKVKSILFSEMISALGHGLRAKYKLKRDSALAAKTGAFLLYTFDELGFIKVMLGKGKNGHGTFIIEVLNDEALIKLWAKLPSNKIDKLPSETPYEPWTTSRHKNGLSMVRTGSTSVLQSITKETHPIIFSVLNKAQSVGWRINKSIYDLHLWALRNKSEAFSDIWEQQNPEARITKLREAKCIGEIAKRFLEKIFFHIYYLDFRGRKYPATAYLHEQGSDLARGLLMREDKKAIGKEGFFWLMVSIASNWAGDSGRLDGAKTDKIPLQARFEWALDNEEILLSYAERPKVNQGWTSADKPWQFLALCLELHKLRVWQSGLLSDGRSLEEAFEDYSYESHLEAFIDG